MPEHCEGGMAPTLPAVGVADPEVPPQVKPPGAGPAEGAVRLDPPGTAMVVALGKEGDAELAKNLGDLHGKGQGSRKTTESLDPFSRSVS